MLKYMYVTSEFLSCHITANRTKQRPTSSSWSVHWPIIRLWYILYVYNAVGVCMFYNLYLCCSIKALLATVLINTFTYLHACMHKNSPYPCYFHLTARVKFILKLSWKIAKLSTNTTEIQIHDTIPHYVQRRAVKSCCLLFQSCHGNGRSPARGCHGEVEMFTRCSCYLDRFPTSSQHSRRYSSR